MEQDISLFFRFNSEKTLPPNLETTWAFFISNLTIIVTYFGIFIDTKKDKVSSYNVQMGVFHISADG